MNRAIFTMLLLVCTLTARADRASARKAIAEKYLLYDKACMRGMAGLATWCEQSLTPDFTIISGGKTTSRANFIAMCRAMAKSPDPAWGGIKEQRVTIDKLTGTDSSTVAEITSRATMVMKDARGSLGARGAVHKINQFQRYRETWVKNDGLWKIRKSEQLSSSMLVDGKLVKRGSK